MFIYEKISTLLITILLFSYFKLCTIHIFKIGKLTVQRSKMIFGLFINSMENSRSRLNQSLCPKRRYINSLYFGDEAAETH